MNHRARIQNREIIAATAVDPNYIAPLAAMVCSIADHADRSCRVRLYVLERGIAASDQATLCEAFTGENIDIEWIHVARECFNELADTLTKQSAMFVTIETYYRLLIPDLLPADIDKVLYLDCDLIFKRDIGELWDSDPGDRYVLAVREFCSDGEYVSSPNGIRLWAQLGLAPTTRVFNAGVMVLNLRKWRQDGFGEQVLRYLRENRENVVWHDQDGLNAMVAGNWGELDPRWNVSCHAYSRSDEPAIAEMLQAPRIIHYNGQFKPWHDLFPFPHRSEFYRYLDRTPWAGFRQAKDPTAEAVLPSRLRRAVDWASRTGHSLVGRVSGFVARAVVRPEHASTVLEPGAVKRREQILKHTMETLRRVDLQGIPDGVAEVRLFMVVRNECLRLPYMLDYYFGKGVDRVFVVDNGSTDGTMAWLLDQRNTHVFYTEDSYGAALCGHAWLLALMHRYGLDRWCVVVDADEVVAYPRWEDRSIKDVCTYLDQHGYEALPAYLLDMYSERPICETTYEPGDNPLTVCRFFDPKYRTKRYLWYDALSGTEFPIETFLGGMRKRVFGTDVWCSKIPLLKYRRGHVLSQGTHGMSGARMADIRGVVFHYKFLHDFIPRVRNEVSRNEHVNDAADYRDYLKQIEREPLACPKFSGSVAYESSRQLVELGIMRSSRSFAHNAPNRPSVTAVAPSGVTRGRMAQE